MLLWADYLRELDFDALMGIYWEANREKALNNYPNMELQAAHNRAEQDFYDYLRDDFFTQKGARYAVWVTEGEYMSALCLEPWEDGLLLEALETRPDHRKKGYAKALIHAVQDSLPNIPVYSHVNKRNSPSLATHKSCGFQIIKDSVRYLDGTVSAHGYTLRWQKNP